ncbi:MAG: response regulator [Oculatellaceae cyanobacterium Prado106]|jgi:DNA-binding response OmpR family regulator|nr:response regulator [Oculatellaceae cyanobacterium Prado106]
MKILLVEEDKVQGAALTEVLEANRYRLDFVTDRQIGLQLAATVDYDLVLLDEQLSPFDSTSLCRRLRSQGYQKPILLLLSHDSNAEVMAGFEAGADDYICKPCAPEVLLEKLRTLLQRSRAASSTPLKMAWGSSKVNRLLEKFRDTFRQRLMVLTQAETALLSRQITPELQQAAQREAHQLAGSLAPFGYSEGSKLARSLEHLLIHPSSLTLAEMSQYSELLHRLQKTLTDPSPQSIDPLSFHSLSYPFQYPLLVIDKDPAMLKFLSRLLSPWGLNVVALSEPQRFWEVLEETLPSLILVNLDLPEVNGLELCQAVRQDTRWANLPILVMMAHPDADLRQQAFASGANDYLTKPLLGSELIPRILSHMERAGSCSETSGRNAR